MKITWHGHSCVLVEGTKKILFDPFLTGNPRAVIKPGDLRQIDYIFITHEHHDHLGDAVEIAKANGSCIVALHEIAVSCLEQGARTEGMNVGGTLDFGGVRVNMVMAVHSGAATGMIIEMDGKTIYHAGDTALFSDMGLYAGFFKIDLAFLPIGDRYTMGPKSAAKAVELLKTPRVIPIHYGTFPLLTGKVEDFRKYVKNAEVIALSPGESFEL